MYVIAILFISLLLIGCTSSATPTPPPSATELPSSSSTQLPAPADTLALTSSAFAAGAEIPVKHTYKISGQCNGDNVSPQLNWTGVPANTKSFALILIDPDGNDWVHWLLFNIPADTTTLPESTTIGVQGKNSFGNLGYGGPCPPSGTHHYVFTLYALDTMLNLKQGAALADATNAMEGHILSQAQLTGIRSR